MSKLSSITKEEIENGELPLQDILSNSLYYPACGFDGGVVKNCNTERRKLGIVSFICCDYATGEEEFKRNQDTFLGYHILGSRAVQPHELIPNGWEQELPPRIRQQNYERYRNYRKPFMHWTVYERDENKEEKYGSKRFSLLYVGGEGVATYQALYWSNHISPRAIAIISEERGSVSNWTNFGSEDGPFAWVVLNNPAGQPDTVYYGSSSYGGRYNKFSWEGFQEDRIVRHYFPYNKGEVRVWVKRESQYTL